ncbi:hypothetical protein PQ469_24890 [Mucilaginibacter sp. KACC 22773]|uniref:hypothetical protein n=1 Tax=Mucilaginibacter sp. KACC 22773 TaxID=3025671 RepID=UPI002365848B|nr:hypothetical protein [Mucilaginibacter sp. KACC 22773]WDF77126.1 hypothetical protein PQ469_24890 [Mucilaginibacter sp. KACC 22773]
MALREKALYQVFKSPNELITAKVNKDFYGIQSTEIKRKDTTVEDFVLNKEIGESTINYTKNSYTPLHVYKALLKIAMSIIPEEETANYKVVIEYLRKSRWEEQFTDFTRICYYQMPPEHRLMKPAVFLFKKRSPDIRLPTHSFALYFENLIYTFPLPFYIPDINVHLYNGQEMTIPLCPPILTEKTKGEIAYQRQLMDFSSRELRKGEQATVHFNADPELLKNLKAYDPKSGKLFNAKLKPEEIIGVHFVPTDTNPIFPITKDDQSSDDQ